MTIKQQGGIFGRNPTFNDVEVDGTLTLEGGLSTNSALTVNAATSTIESTGGAQLYLSRDDTAIANNNLIGGLAFKGNDSSASPDPQYCGMKAYAAGSGNNPVLEFYSGNGNYDARTPQLSINYLGDVQVHTRDLFVAKTSQDVDTDGIELRSDGVFVTTANNASPIFANRRSSDGAIATFMQSGSTVGSIKCRSSGGNLQIDTGQSGIDFGGDGYLPMRNGAITDNSLDIGSSSFRYQDIYATNGTIQTSDRNEKQDIAELSEAERRVAVAAKGLLRKFRWQSAVTEKGDNARIHFGIIAQDLQAAFAAEGLDAGDYGMFISTTWWEHAVEVPAVEAVDKVTETSVDEEGNETVTVITPAVEARDAYTLREAYETAEEAPEGSVQKTRLGVRYPELLAFIIAAM